MRYKLVLKSVIWAGACCLFNPQWASAQDDNIANCEIVVQKPIDIDDGDKAQLTTYMPAYDFFGSVFDNEPGHITEVDGQRILALMCQRRSIIPTQFDKALIQTDVPLFLSPNFDANDTPMLSVIKIEGRYKGEYSGPDMDAQTQLELETFLSDLNSENNNSQETINEP